MMNTSAVYSGEYLQMCLSFMSIHLLMTLIGFARLFGWSKRSTASIPIHPQNQDFVYSLLVNIRLVVSNNRLKRSCCDKWEKFGMIKTIQSKNYFWRNCISSLGKEKCFCRKTHIHMLFCSCRRCFEQYHDRW